MWPVQEFSLYITMNNAITLKIEGLKTKKPKALEQAIGKFLWHYTEHSYGSKKITGDAQ